MFIWNSQDNMRVVTPAYILVRQVNETLETEGIYANAEELIMQLDKKQNNPAIVQQVDEVDCFLRFHFSNSASVQILIDDLIIVRDSIAGGRTLLASGEKQVIVCTCSLDDGIHEWNCAIEVAKRNKGTRLDV